MDTLINGDVKSACLTHDSIALSKAMKIMSGKIWKKKAKKMGINLNEPPKETTTEETPEPSVKEESVKKSPEKQEEEDELDKKQEVVTSPDQEKKDISEIELSPSPNNMKPMDLDQKPKPHQTSQSS